MAQYHPCHLWLQIPMRPCGNLGLAEICLCCIFHLHLQALVVHGLLCDSGQDRRCLLALQCLPLAIHTLLFESLLASVVEVSMGASPYGPPQSVMLPCLPQRDCLENVASAWTGRGVCSRCRWVQWRWEQALVFQRRPASFNTTLECVCELHMLSFCQGTVTTTSEAQLTVLIF